MNLLNVSDQADVNALVVHWSTPLSISDTFEFEKANADRKKRMVAAKRSMLGGRAGGGKGTSSFMCRKSEWLVRGSEEHS